MKRLEKELNLVLKKMGIPLKCVWAPSDSPKKHAELIPQENLIVIYDKSESEAFNSLIHEVVEYRLRKVTSLYMALINKLIEGLEEITYREKEKAIAEIIMDFKRLKKITDD